MDYNNLKMHDNTILLLITGLNIENFLNCVMKSIPLKNIKRKSYTSAYIEVSFRNYKKILSIADKNQVEIFLIKANTSLKIKNFLVNKWWLITIAFLIVLATMIISNLYLSTEIKGIDNINEFELMEFLKNNGVSKYKLKKKIDTNSIEKSIYISFKEVAYVDAKFDGTKLIITIDEKYLQPSIHNKNNANILAQKSGVIEKVIVKSGKALVEEGDIVHLGDALITGTYTKNDIVFNVPANIKDLPIKLKRTGKMTVEKYMELGNLKIKLSGNNTFNLYMTEESVDDIISNNIPNMKIREIIYYECVVDGNTSYDDTLKKEVIEKAYFDALKNMPDNAIITDFNSYIVYNENIISSYAVITAKEKIGYSKPAVSESEDTTDIGA